jgi:hypothetical protein
MFSCEFLHGHAVEGAEAEDEVNTIYTNDLAVGEELLEGIEGDAVGGVVEVGTSTAVCDIEVGVARGESLAAVNDGFGHGEGDDAEGAAVEIAGAAEEVEVFLEGFVVGVWRGRVRRRGRRYWGW